MWRQRAVEGRGDGGTEGGTPPIDQSPSSSLLSFLQFVNFSKSRMDSGWGAQTSRHAVAAFGWNLAHPEQTAAFTSFPSIAVSWSFWGNCWLTAQERGKKPRLSTKKPTRLWCDPIVSSKRVHSPRGQAWDVVEPFNVFETHCGFSSPRSATLLLRLWKSLFAVIALLRHVLFSYYLRYFFLFNQAGHGNKRVSSYVVWSNIWPKKGHGKTLLLLEFPFYVCTLGILLVSWPEINFLLLLYKSRELADIFQRVLSREPIIDHQIITTYFIYFPPTWFKAQLISVDAWKSHFTYRSGTHKHARMPVHTRACSSH